MGLGTDLKDFLKSFRMISFQLKSRSEGFRESRLKDFGTDLKDFGTGLKDLGPSLKDFPKSFRFAV